jgi:hypothetical protein
MLLNEHSKLGQDDRYVNRYIGWLAYHSPPSSARVKNDATVPPFPQYIFTAWYLID